MAEAQHPACKLVTIQDDKGAEFIGIRLQPGARSMAYNHSTLCMQPHSRTGEQSVASGT